MFLFMAPFLAMAKLKQAWLSPSVLTKMLHFIKSVSEIMTIAYGFFRLHKKRMRRHQRRRISHDFQRSEIFKPKNNYSKFK